jgi:DNA helicase HerA-like ATPase/DNA-binding Lrp family transcriptional regulator
MWGKKEVIKYYELFPKVEYDKTFNILNSLGHVFEIIYAKDKDLMHLYAYTNTQLEVLRKDFGVNENVNIPVPKFVGRISFRNEKDFYWGAEFNDFSSFLTKLQPGEQLRLWIVLEPRLNDIFLKYSDKLKRNQSVIGKRQREVLASRLEQFAKDNIYYLQPYVLSDDRKRVKELAKQLQQFILTKSRKLRLEIRKTKGWEDYIPRIPRFYSLKLKRWLWVDEEKINKVAVIPNPSVLKVKFIRSAQLPVITVERKDILVGHLEDGTPFKLDLEDLYRHMYIVGATGSGKSTTIAKLVVELKKLTNKKKAQVVIDPNHDLVRDLSIYADYYFDATIPNFSVNPLQLPRVFENREDNISLGVSIALAILEKLLGLVETAVNVKYIFQVLLSKLYEKTDSPTLSDIYELVLALRNEELDLDVNDEIFEKEVEALQQMPAQSFISLLSRLKPFVENRVLNQVTSSSTINWDEILKDNTLVLFDTNKGKLGEIPSYLVQASIITSLFYWVLQRSLKSSDRMPIITYVDEFQNVAHLPYIKEILAEARKYGLHLVMANQNLAQLEEAGVLEHVLSNTNVKFIMAQSSPRGQELATKLDKAFSEELQEVVPNLSVGEAVVFMRARPGEKTAPVKVLVEKVNEVGNEDTAKQLALKTAEKFAPRETKKKDTKAMLNPVLRYCEVPKPLEQYILYYIWKSDGHTAFQADLLKDLGIDRDRLRSIIARLQQDGYITTEKIGNKLKLQYNRGLFRLKGIVDNELGKKIAMKVMVNYLKHGYTVTRGKQEGDIRPDLVAFVIDKSTFRPHYNEAIAIEIESPNEIEVHPEQVRRNMQKYIPIVDLFKEIHLWTSEEKFDKLKQIYDSFLADNSVPQEYKQKVKIFSVKIKKKEIEQQSKEKQKTKPETGEFNGKESEEPESKAENKVITAAQGAVANNKQQNEVQTIAATTAANNVHGTVKLGSLTLKEVTIEVLREDNDYAVIRIGDKQYRVLKTDLELLKAAAKDPELLEDVKLKENKILIQAAGTKKTILLAPT